MAGLLAALLAPMPAAGQTGSPLSALDSRPGISTLTRSTYEGKGLYGHINGGAELYHEYGFVRVEVRTIVAENETLTVESYEMSDSFAAAGILSVSRGGCDTDTALGPLAFTSRFQSQLSRGRFYLRVINGKGEEAARGPAGGAMRSVAKIILPGLAPGASESTSGSDRAPALLILLRRTFSPAAGHPPLLFRGPLGLQNGLDGWSEFFEGCGRFELVAVDVDTVGGGFTAGAVTFSDPGDRERVLGSWSRPAPSIRRYHAEQQGALLLFELRGRSPLIDEWEKALRDAGALFPNQR